MSEVETIGWMLRVFDEDGPSKKLVHCTNTILSDEEKATLLDVMKELEGWFEPLTYDFLPILKKTDPRKDPQFPIPQRDQ